MRRGILRYKRTPTTPDLKQFFLSLPLLFVNFCRYLNDPLPSKLHGSLLLLILTNSSLRGLPRSPHSLRQQRCDGEGQDKPKRDATRAKTGGGGVHWLSTPPHLTTAALHVTRDGNRNRKQRYRWVDRRVGGWVDGRAGGWVDGRVGE